MMQKLIHETQASSGRHYYLYNTGFLLTAYKGAHLDFETLNPEALEVEAQKVLSDLPANMSLRFSSHSDYIYGRGPANTKREKAISEIGINCYQLNVYFEKNLPGFMSLFNRVIRNKWSSNFIHDFVEQMDSEIKTEGLNSLGLNLQPSKCNINFDNQEFRVSRAGLQVDNRFFSIIKLNKLGTHPIDLEELTILREFLPDPSFIVTKIKRLDEKEIQFFLQRKSKREESGHDLPSQRKYVASQKAIEEVDLLGKTLFKFENTIVLVSASEAEAIEQAFEVKNRLKPLGDYGVEHVGAFPSFLAALPGGRDHVSHVEIVDRVSAFLPITMRGVDQLAKTSKRALVFHRLNGSVDCLDPFDKNYSNYSGIVIGRSGRGKSVFVNTLLQSLHNDEKTRIILVDVKGSHTNTVDTLGGEIYKIGSNHAGLVSPFQFLNFNTDKSTIEILADFLEKVLIEENETGLQRSEQSILERCLTDYAQSDLKTPSLDGFLRFSKTIPRKENLLRWQKGGIYESVFSNYGDFDTEKRLQYFDFTNIVTAQKGGVGPSVMSAIMAHFNFLLMNKKTDHKLIFIADETPFFVRNCFSSFNLLMKNVRKLNGSLILVAQNLSDLVVDGDSSLISQPELKIFFTKDGGSEKFENNSGLSSEGLNTLDGLKCVKGKFSQFLIKDPLGERVGCLYLAKRELLQATTEAGDRRLIEKLKEALGLKTDLEAIEILANIGGEYELAQ